MARIKGERRHGPRTNTTYTIIPTTKFDLAAMKQLRKAGRIPAILIAKSREDLLTYQGMINAVSSIMAGYCKRRRIDVGPTGTLTLFGTTTLRDLGI